MGAYVSTANCAAHYGVTPNCTVVWGKGQSMPLALGDSTFGNFPSDPDIAGIGILGAFICVTVTSLVLATANMIWWSAKNILQVKNRLTREEKSLRNRQLSISGILEVLILTCSDQQVFTGGAYAITLRYSKACSVSAYHYNVVANILLVTCATHLMAVTVARNYWEHPYVAVLRIAVTTLVYIITGVLLSYQGSGSLGFPTEVPHHTHTYSLMLLPAACFQSGEFLFGAELEKALTAGSLRAFLADQIHGWTNYILMSLFYIIAIFVSLGRVVCRGMDRGGKRQRFVAWLERTFPLLCWLKRFFYSLFGLYLFAGIAISSWTVGGASIYVFRLRRWVDKSGWIEKVNNRNPENDPSTFGQLVPLLLISLTVFTFLQIISERITPYTSVPQSASPASRGPRSSHSTVSVVDVGTLPYDSPYPYPDPRGHGKEDGSKPTAVVGVAAVSEHDESDNNYDDDDDDETGQSERRTLAGGDGHGDVGTAPPGLDHKPGNALVDGTGEEQEQRGGSPRSVGDFEPVSLTRTWSRRGRSERGRYMALRSPASSASLPVGLGMGGGSGDSAGGNNSNGSGSDGWFGRGRRSQSPAPLALVPVHDDGAGAQGDLAAPAQVSGPGQESEGDAGIRAEFGLAGVEKEFYRRTL